MEMRLPYWMEGTTLAGADMAGGARAAEEPDVRGNERRELTEQRGREGKRVTVKLCSYPVCGGMWGGVSVCQAHLPSIRMKPPAVTHRHVSRVCISAIEIQPHEN